jgi:hypothetical protein
MDSIEDNKESLVVQSENPFSVGSRGVLFTVRGT